MSSMEGERSRSSINQKCECLYNPFCDINKEKAHEFNGGREESQQYQPEM